MLLATGLLSAGCTASEQAGGSDAQISAGSGANVSNQEKPAQPSNSTATSTQASAIDEPKFKKGDDYKTVVREKLLKDGWEPYTSKNADKCEGNDDRCVGMPEMENCAGTGLGNCRYLWKKGEKAIVVYTVDAPPLFTDVDVIYSKIDAEKIAGFIKRQKQIKLYCDDCEDARRIESVAVKTVEIASERESDPENWYATLNAQDGTGRIFPEQTYFEEKPGTWKNLASQLGFDRGKYPQYLK